MATLNLSEALNIARTAADAGAAIAMRKRSSSEELSVRSKGRADFVTDVDCAAQAAIIEIIRLQYPDHRFLAEEEGADSLGDPASPYRWIIDPLDGTTPYIHGSEHFGTIVALQENDRTLIGAMTIPMRNERFWGARGLGAFFNGTRIIGLRQTHSLDDAIICTNLGKHPPPIDLVRFRCASLQNYGCAATEIGAILRGQNDGVVFADGPRLWDAAAGCLLAEEAGGEARLELADPRDPRGAVRCVASTKPIFDALCKELFP